MLRGICAILDCQWIIGCGDHGAATGLQGGDTVHFHTPIAGILLYHCDPAVLLLLYYIAYMQTDCQWHFEDEMLA